jgi:3-deoxy-D-manno-octulosonate 8-phosphate phosphatase (KDO 8-P phosphatase)
MKNVKLIVLDVDGVLTNGNIYISELGHETKSFNVKDGMGINLASHLGYKVALISGRNSASVQKRAAELKIDYVFQGIKDKIGVLEGILSELNLTFNEVCYMGDDLNDLPIIKKAGVSYAPQDAHHFVKNHVDTVTSLGGGKGAVREMIDDLLKEKYSQSEIIELFEYKDLKKITQ